MAFYKKKQFYKNAFGRIDIPLIKNRKSKNTNTLKYFEYKYFNFRNNKLEMDHC